MCVCVCFEACVLETFWPEVPKVCVCVSVVCVVCVCVLEPRNIPAKGAQSVCVCFVGEVEVGGVLEHVP